MKFKVISDLHLEGSSLNTVNIANDEQGNLVDVLVLAGDIAVYPDLIDRHILNIPEDVNVIYVPGNHEYECKIFNDVIPSLKNMFPFPNWHILNNETIVFGNTRFICSTLWADLKVNGDSLYEANYEQAQLILQSQKTKCRLENGTFKPFGVTEMFEEFVKSKKFIANELSNDFEGKTVVITHFSPSLKSAENKYKLSGFWASDLSDIMNGVDFWCHGHIHTTSEYMIGNTKIISNPRGYSATYDLSQNTSFDITKSIELDINPLARNKLHI